MDKQKEAHKNVLKVSHAFKSCPFALGVAVRHREIGT